MKLTHLYIYVFLAVFLITKCNAQDIKRIQLKKIKTEHVEKGFDYQMETLTDTTYLEFKRSGDFGRVYAVYFVLKDSLPDGKYEVYVDDELRQEAYYKNKRKENIWIEHKENGERREVSYKDGEIFGKIMEYNSSNNLLRMTKFKDNKIQFRESHYESGKTKMKEYYRDKRCYKIKKYDSLGKLEKKQNFIRL